MQLVKQLGHRSTLLRCLYRPLLRLTAANAVLQDHVKRSFRRSTRLGNDARVTQQMDAAYKVITPVLYGGPE